MYKVVTFAIINCTTVQLLMQKYKNSSSLSRIFLKEEFGKAHLDPLFRSEKLLSSSIEEDDRCLFSGSDQ